MQRSFGRFSGFSLVVLSIAVLSLSAASHASAQDRIVEAIENGKVSALPGTMHPLAQARFDQGPLDGGRRLPGMSIDFQRTPAQQSALAALLKAQLDPSSPSYHHWLTAEEFGAQFGMSHSDIGKATAWLQSQGFTIDKVADSQNSIRFSGMVAQAEAAFHTQIHKYTVNGQVHFANSTAVSLPQALASSVIHVGGLNNFGPKPGNVRPNNLRSGPKPAFTSGSNAPDAGSHYLAPSDFAIIYDLNPLYTAGFNGSGQTIGIMGQTDIVMADITDFRTNAQLPAYNTTGNPTFTSYLIPGATDPGVQYLSGDVNEADLDIEWSGGVAPNANILFVISSEDEIFDALQYAIENTINGLQVPILSISYAGCEAAQSTAAIQSLEASFQQANVQGQTVINSSGDSGAAACDDQTEIVTSAVQGLAVNYPASSAYVTGLGGSEFMGDGTAANPSTGADQYWLGTGSTDLLTSAKSYIPEGAWNDTAFVIPLGGGLSAGGGGKSILFTKPSWQAGVPGIPNDNARDVPDLSLSASADHDGYLVCTQIILASDDNPDPTSADFTSSCSVGFRISDPNYAGPPDEDDNGYPTIYGGTSVAAPSFAGILALIEQKLGTPLGNINPTLYTLASNSATYASAFHDITTGNNEVPCTSGSPNCPTSGTQVIGYVAGTGYDEATGLGSVDGNELAIAFGTVETKAGTTTGVVLTPTAPVVGQAITLSATIKPNTGSATAPTGTVIFSVDGVAVNTADVTAGTATYSPYSFSTGGTHTITAAYSGDSNYFASTTTSTVTVTAASTAAPTTTTLSTGGVTTVALNQGSITLTATVTSATAGTIAGQVEFTIGTVTLAPVQVTSGASGSATASTTVAATAANGFTAGTTSISAAYGGDSAYSGSASTATVISVTNPALTMTVANMTISGSAPGNTGTSAISITSTGGYAGTVNLTATATTLDASYSITPTSVSIASGGTGTASISIQTIASDIRKGVNGNLRRATTSNNRVIVGAAAAFLGGIFLLGIPGFRKKRWPMLTMLLLLGALSGGIGCGGGGGGSGSGASPKGTYTVTVTATDSATASITVSTNFTVTIQ